MIDLDANATTRLLPEVLDAMLPWLHDCHANPSGAYAGAKRTRHAIEEAREQVAALIGARPEEIIFTSGGTESVNTALHSLHALTPPGGKAVVSAIEHSAVLRCVDGLAREVERVAVGHDGVLDLDALRQSSQGAAFLSVMAANNETGVIQPLREAIAIARERGVPIHTDAIQAVGKTAFRVDDHPADLISISAHKFHGPKGIGALYCRRGLEFSPLLRGGGQEMGMRSGTENTPAIIGMGVAARIAAEQISSGQAGQLSQLRDSFERKVMAGLDGVTRNGMSDRRLGNTSHLSFEGCEAAGLLVLLDEAGIQCSAGSACMTGKQQPSHVQLAMGIAEPLARSSLRFSFSRFNTPEEADAAASAVIRAVNRLREIQGSGTGPVVVYSP